MATVELGDLPDRIDVKVLAGEPFELTVPVLDQTSTPVPMVNLTSARAQVRPSIDSNQVLHLFSTEDDEPDAEITDDGVVLTASSGTTALWQQVWPGIAPTTVVWWDLEVTDAGGVVHQVTMPGLITLYHQVTR
jgi:hypothetical protein